MVWFGFFSSTTSESQAESGRVTSSQTTAIAIQGDLEADSKSRETSVVNGSSNAPKSTTTFPPQDFNVSANEPQQSKEGRRFSFQSLVFKRQVEHATTLSPIAQGKTQEKASETAESSQRENNSKSKKRALQSALVVRTVIVGPTSAGPKMTAAVAKPELKKIKSQLLEPKRANELILQLRKLPAHGDPSQTNCNGPIHAVCLSHPDEEEAALLSDKLAASIPTGDVTSLFALPGVVAAPLDKVAEIYKGLSIIDLVTTPDLGLGQPGDGNGLLAGAVPTAETVIRGFEQVTPQLMALGFATGKLIVPDHTGINPPVDRMSVLTYWWGLELLLPPPSLRYLSSVQSVTGAIMNFLSALALVNNGVREILPFIRYFAQFIDFEFSTIKRQDRGNGVVCAATWIMPAAMIPRPWDFPVPQVPEGDFSNPNLPQDHGIVIPSGPSSKPANSIADIVANINPAPNLTPIPASPPKPASP